MTDRIEDWPISGINVTVTRIDCCDKNIKAIGSASGLFFKHGDNKYLVTNRHVVVDVCENFFPEILSIKLHNDKHNYSANNTILINLYNNGKQNWLEHPEISKTKADIAVIPLNNTVLDSANTALFNSSIVNFITEKNFPQNIQLSSFANVAIVGYPLGFHDEVNNLPVYRKGMIASSYPIKFNQLPYFLIDAVLHEGTSGSPVISSPDNILVNDKGSFHSEFTYFLGIHSAEHVTDDEPLSLCVVWYPELILEIINGIAP